ncbi:MAG: two-component system sensor histidine kinase NtrB [Syntrophomonadaceae bacterium]
MDDSPLRRSLFWLTAVRIVVLFLILLSAILVQAGSGAEASISYLYGLCAAAVVMSLFDWTLGRMLPTRAEAYLQVLGDLGLVCVLVYSSGGPSSVFTFLYLVVIGAAAFLLFRTGALVIASVAALLHGLMIELTAYDVLPRPALAVPRWGAERSGYNLAITVAGFYGVAFMVSYLSEKLRAAREELEQRQKALSRIQTLYASVIASMSSGLVTTDAEERVTFLNQAGGDILGIVPARAVGKRIREIGLALPNDWNEIRQRSRGREGFRAEIEIERGASRRVVGYSVRALKDPDGHDAALVVFQDLTEVKKLERQARFNEQLAAVGELAAGIAHEIRNPLASISGSVQVLSHDLSVGSAERRLMEIIVSESNRLSKILEEFLRFVRPQERRVAVFDVAGNIQEVLDLFRLSDEVSDAHAIVVDVEPAPSVLAGDRDQIRQIIYNVAKNALRAMADGGTLTVQGREDGAWYSIKFRDTGRGMSDEEVARVFTPFSTAFDGGTGLGMAIVRRIVEDHGGAIDVESRPGEGTTVTILLPRQTAPRADARDHAAAAPEAVS